MFDYFSILFEKNYGDFHLKSWIMDFSTRFIRGKKPIYHDYFYISLSYFLLLLISLHNYRGQKNGRRTIEQGQTNGRRKMFYTIKEKKERKKNPTNISRATYRRKKPIVSVQHCSLAVRSMQHNIISISLYTI